MKQFAKTAAAVLSVFAVTAFLLVFVSPMSAHAASDGGITMAQAQEILGITDGSEPYVFEYAGSLTAAFNAIAAQEKGGILLIGKAANFTSAKFTTATAPGKTVIITSYYTGTYGGKSYDTDYRETVGAKLQFYTSSSSVTSFSWGLGMNAYIDCLDIVNGKSSINAKVTIACNWNDLYIGKNVTCTAPSATASQAFPAIVAGYDRDQYATGADFPAGETQNITVESGSWCYVAGGDMSTAELGTEEKPLREVAGNINITLNGGYYYGESDSALDVDRYGYNSHPSVLARCFAKYTETSNTKLVINGGEYQSAVFGYGITQHPTTAASNTTEQAGNLTIDFNGGKIACTRIRLDASTYAGTTDSLAGTTVVANLYGGELIPTAFYITTNSLTETNTTVNWYDDGSALAKRLATAASKSGSYVKNKLTGVTAVFTLPSDVTVDDTAEGILGAVIVRNSRSGVALDRSAYTASENIVTATIAPNISEGSEYTVGLHAADSITVYTFTYTDGAWVCSEPVVDTEHKAETYWENGDLHYGCKKCGSVGRITAQHDENGAPVVFAALMDEFGNSIPRGHGLTPDSPVNNVLQVKAIFDQYKKNGALPSCVVVVVGVLAPGADFEIDYGAPVTFTSVWDNVNYCDAGARLKFAHNGHFRSDTTFKNVCFEHIENSLSFIAMNGNNLTITDCGLYNGEPYCDDLLEGSSSYAIISGEYLDAKNPGSDLSDLNQTIRIDSGIWRCVDVGNFRSITSSSFLKMNGKVTVSISGTAKFINKSATPAYMYRGMSACSQILSDELNVIYNISGGSFKLSRGLNAIGRDSQAPADGSVRNINATYNITGGNFNKCALNSVTVTAESLPTSGKVIFNIAPGLFTGTVTTDESRDITNALMEFTAGSFSVIETQPRGLRYSVHITEADRSYTIADNGIKLVEYGMLMKMNNTPSALEYIDKETDDVLKISKSVSYKPAENIDRYVSKDDGIVFEGSVTGMTTEQEKQDYNFRPYAVYETADGSTFVSYGAKATSRVDADGTPAVPEAGWTALHFYAENGVDLPFQIYMPQNYDPSKEYPCILYMHSAGVRCDDNSHIYTDEAQFLRVFESSSYKNEAIIIAPCCPNTEKWIPASTWNQVVYDYHSTEPTKYMAATLELFASYRSALSIDEKRLYTYGMSMGAFAVWDLLARNPDTFAAAIPVAGAGDPTTVRTMTNTAIWIFHGNADASVPVESAYKMLEALEAAGRDDIKYTEFDGKGHGIWTLTANTEGLLDWLFAQTLSEEGLTVTVEDSYAADTGAGSYKEGSTVTIYAGNRSGYIFSGWTSADVTVTNPKNARTTFVMPDHPVTVTATWTPEDDLPVYAVTVVGSYAADTGAGSYRKGVTVTVNAGSRSGYAFNGWTSADVTITNAANTKATFIMPDHPVTIKATWTYYMSWEPETGTLTFNTNGGSPLSPVRDILDTTISLASYKPTREGYIFDGWYSDSGLTNQVTSVKLTKNITVFAGWKKVELPPPQATFSFNDVTEKDWFYEDVLYAYENNLMNGTSDTEFSPYLPTTRGQIVTILWRLEGSPETAYTGELLDVPAGMYYAPAIRWAAATGIMNGYGDGKFCPENEITREQLAALLYRYAVYKKYDVSGRASLSTYGDASNISAYATEYVQWAVDKGLIQGMDNNLIAPQGNAIRAQVAAVLHRFCENIAK